MIDNKGFHTKTHNYYTSENEGKRKESWKQPGEWGTLPTGKIYSDNSRFLIRNYGDQNKVSKVFSCAKNRAVN